MSARGLIRLAVLCLAPAGGAGGAALPFEFRVAALVQAGPARWPEIPGEASIRRVVPGKFRRPFLEPGPGIPSRSGTVTRALAVALQPLRAAERDRPRDVLGAIGDWAATALTGVPDPVPCPAAWRSAGAVIASGRGHGFELIRAAAALARAAGIPARPTYNGVPVVAVWVAAPGVPGAWTVWDPLRRPGADTRRLPVAWLPLRGGDLPPVTLVPHPVNCATLIIEVRRHLERDAAARDVESIRLTGRFRPEPPPPLHADAASWWEAWAIGADVELPATRSTAVVALPYVRELDYGTREHAVWVSDPARAPTVTGPLSETDPSAGGIVMTLKLAFRAAPR